MKKRIINIFKYLFFLGLGVFLLWISYKDTAFDEILTAFKEVNYFWISISLLLSVLSLVSRAMRWQLLIDSSGYKTGFVNVFLSCYILYFVNLLVPRAGEVARCTVVSTTEKVPFPTLFGTMVVERLADMIMLILIALVVIPLRITDFTHIFSNNAELSENFKSLVSFRNIMILSVLLVLMLLIFFVVIKKLKKANSLFWKKIMELWKSVKQGVFSILQLEKKWAFIGHTIFIFLMWLGMLYVVFLAFDPTSKLTVAAGVVTFFMGGLAMLAPINGGIGAWHYMVIISLVGAFGVASSDASIFAVIAHTTTSLVYLIFGVIALGVLFMLNKGNFSLSRKKE